jgi:hypothetical protein
LKAEGVRKSNGEEEKEIRLRPVRAYGVTSRAREPDMAEGKPERDREKEKCGMMNAKRGRTRRPRDQKAKRLKRGR